MCLGGPLPSCSGCARPTASCLPACLPACTPARPLRLPTKSWTPLPCQCLHRIMPTLSFAANPHVLLNFPILLCLLWVASRPPAGVAPGQCRLVLQLWRNQCQQPRPGAGPAHPAHHHGARCADACARAWGAMCAGEVWAVRAWHVGVDGCAVMDAGAGVCLCEVSCGWRGGRRLLYV